MTMPQRKTPWKDKRRPRCSYAPYIPPGYIIGVDRDGEPIWSEDRRRRAALSKQEPVGKEAAGEATLKAINYLRDAITVGLPDSEIVRRAKLVIGE